MNVTVRDLRFTVLAAALAVLAGCAGFPGNSAASRATAPPPSNVYHGSERLPRSLKRVAMLPLGVSEADEAQADALRASLGPALYAELARTGHFELIPVSPESLQQWTGQPQWRASDRLPLDFFDRIRQETECDGVLFSELTAYRPYPPLAIGWRIQLVSADGPQVWWAVEELFDANDAAVANSARRYHLAHTTQPLALTDAREILNSPRRFGSYTASVIVATCPAR